MAKVFTADEVAKHTANSDCWTIMHGKVYDITKYFGQHPGGDMFLEDVAGKDGTVMFEEMFHSDGARDILNKYLIGTLQTAAQESATVSAPAAAPHMHIGTAPSSTINMHPDQFENFAITKITKVSHDSSIFKFALPSKSKLNLPIGHHIQICVPNPHNKDEHTVRKYTPICSNEEGSFDVLIKRYENGIVSKHVHSLNVGDSVLMRGPFGSYAHHADKYSLVCMFAAGTGIAPMYQVIQAMLAPNSNNTNRILLIYANKTVEDILLKAELEALVKSNPLRFSIVNCLSREKSKPKDEPNISYILGHVSESVVASNMYTHVSVTQALICGTDSFNDKVKDMMLNFKKMPAANIHLF